MSDERERYDATLGLLAERKVMCGAAVPEPPWSPCYNEAISAFIAAHDPATLLRVYSAAEKTLRRHAPRDEFTWCRIGCSLTWPCPDALGVMDTWLPITEETAGA